MLRLALGATFSAYNRAADASFLPESRIEDCASGGHEVIERGAFHGRYNPIAGMAGNKLDVRQCGQFLLIARTRAV